MEIQDVIKEVAATFERDASSQAVFGPAIELEHHKVVPVAVVASGAGGGLSEKGSAGGMGFGVNVRPVGFIHEAGDHVIFTPIHVDPQYRSARAEVASFGLRRLIDLFASFMTAFMQRRSSRLPPRVSRGPSEVGSPS